MSKNTPNNIPLESNEIQLEKGIITSKKPKNLKTFSNNPKNNLNIIKNENFLTKAKNIFNIQNPDEIIEEIRLNDQFDTINSDKKDLNNLRNNYPNNFNESQHSSNKVIFEVGGIKSLDLSNSFLSSRSVKYEKNDKNYKNTKEKENYKDRMKMEFYNSIFNNNSNITLNSIITKEENFNDESEIHDLKIFNESLKELNKFNHVKSQAQINIKKKKENENSKNKADKHLLMSKSEYNDKENLFKELLKKSNKEYNNKIGSCNINPSSKILNDINIEVNFRLK